MFYNTVAVVVVVVVVAAAVVVVTFQGKQRECIIFLTLIVFCYLDFETLNA